ncbi:uncharacterized protein EURHEDRAFT_410961 [Aspergillus ruber CBS 135680]|uniref:Uncharacterized protein n=1 Tax=Aspergillus ruber (strain CBS 135680) TaxID=1388766 RepID=A0A017SHJ8_ASPRC|nr:uncharacterized protein EURHEDRAFT_410961 [Aspergillus ruber CBS 135680]EYE96437.1 hypothetical protein EURHEDRAFT_410961 [Aspergillus ruber CBS 135680]
MRLSIPNTSYFLAYLTISPLLTLWLGIQTVYPAANKMSIYGQQFLLSTSCMRIDCDLQIGGKTGNCFRVSRKIPDKLEWYLRPHPISKHVQRITK